MRHVTSNKHADASLHPAASTTAVSASGNERLIFEPCADQRACCAASLRGCNELRSCNQKAPFRICALRAALSTSREVYCSIFCNRKTIVAQIPAMTLALSKTENGKITCSKNYSQQPQWLPLPTPSFPQMRPGGMQAAAARTSPRLNHRSRRWQ